MAETDMILLFAVTILGAITTSGLGWADSGKPFNARKFIPGLIRGAIAAAGVFAAQYSGYIGDVNPFTYIFAFFAGGGFDVVVNRGAGILGIGQEKTAPTT